jgi:hypothetical protein
MDLNRNAFRIVNSLTAETKESPRAAAARSAGKAGGRARAVKLTPSKRREIAVKASAARWSGRTEN